MDFIGENNMKQSRVASNAAWIIFCRIIQSVLQLIIGMLSARYLGPANYGLINYAKSLVAFVVPVAQLGLSATLVQELINDPDKEGEILGTSLMISLLSSVICIMALQGVVSVINYGETETRIVCFLYSLKLIFQTIELVRYWFHSKLKSKYPSLMMLCAYIIVFCYKIFLLATGKSIYWFAIIDMIEAAIIGLSLLFIYHIQKNQFLRVSFSRAKRLFSKSKYYILSSMMVTVFQNTDHVMLKTMSGDVENGFYSAAITCACVFQFVYVAIIDSLRPVILENKKKESEDYEKSLSGLYGFISYLSLAQSIVFSICSGLIVRVLYGAEYAPSAMVLRIFVWDMAFSYMGKIRNIWILAEGKQSFLWKINLFGVLFNVAVNAILIPLWGACGAALATVFTQIFTNFIIGFIYKPLKGNNELLLQGLNPRVVADLFRKIVLTSPKTH